MFTPAQHAAFNAWANQRLLAVCATLSKERLQADRGAYFKSIWGTLNHILLVDMLYLDRLHGRPSHFKRLDEPVCLDFLELQALQTEQDRVYAEYVDTLTPAALERNVRFRTLLAEAQVWTVPMRLYLSNLFQHQTHHRGQVHNLLSQEGLDPPPLGFVEYALEAGLVAPPESVEGSH